MLEDCDESNLPYIGSADYRDTVLRNWLNNTLLNGFSTEVQNNIKTQNYSSWIYTISDKVKCPSVTELGYTDNNTSGYSYRVEGTIYPIFSGSEYSNMNDLAIRKRPNGSNANYWTRTANLNNSGQLMYISSNYYGSLNYGGIAFRKYSIAIIRF